MTSAERGGGSFVALFRQLKINGVTKFIDRSVQVNQILSVLGRFLKTFYYPFF